MIGWLLRRRNADSIDRAARLVEAGQACEAALDFSGAERAYRRALSAAPGEHDSRYLLARLLGRRGELNESERLLRLVVDGLPNFAPAHRDYGLVLRSLGRAGEAKAQFEAAIHLDGSDPVALLNLAVLHQETGELDQAERTLRSLLDRHPGLPDAAERHGEVLLARGQLEEAEQAFKAAFASRPSTGAAYNLGVIRQRLGDAAGACQHLSRALELDAEHVPSLHALGRIALRDGDVEKAIEWLVRAVDADPARPDLHRDLGGALIQMRRWDEAGESLDTALTLAPEDVDAQFARAVVDLNRRRYADAERRYRGLVSQRPTDAKALSGHGTSLYRLGRFEEAADTYRRALELTPDLPEAVNNLGVALQEMGEFERAVAHFEQALEKSPTFLDALTNLGLAHLDLGHTKEAIDCFERALAIDPALDEARFNRTVAKLRSGDFESGWDDYEKRWVWRFSIKPPFDNPLWDGLPLKGRRLLVHAEQGLGDEMMFASCVPDLIRREGSFTLECSPKLKKLFARSFPQVTVVSDVREQPAELDRVRSSVDCRIPSGSLPGLFRRSRDAFPLHDGYLRADPARVEHWRGRLRALGPGMKVGLSWRGGAVKTRRRLRSLSLDELAPLLRIPDVSFVSLQYTDCSAEVRSFENREGIKVHHWQEAIDDYDETAALVVALDFVITVCTAVVHLTGALGRPALVMVPYSPEWRYGDRGDRMPWYPSARIIRQATPGDWDPVIGEVARRVSAIVRGDGDVLA